MPIRHATVSVVILAVLSPCFAVDPKTPPVDPQTTKYISLLVHKDPAMRTEAARVLGTIGDPHAVPALSKTTYDKNPRVRCAAAFALVAFATDSGIPPFEYPLVQKRQQVVFPLRRNGKACIYSILSDGTGLKKLSQGPGDYEPSLSSNGLALVYCASRQRTINVRDMKSAKIRTLAAAPAGSGVDGPRISDDGNVVIYLRYDRRVFAARPGSKKQIFLSKKFPAAGFYGLAISGNGSKVAFDSGRPRKAGSGLSSPAEGELFVLDADGSNLRRITTNGPKILDINPALSRDGKRLAFMSGNYPNWDIWVAQSDGTGTRNVSRHEATDSTPAISPDGTKIAFASDRNGDREIYTVGFDGEGLVQLTDSELQCVNPRFSADGTRIFFETCHKHDRKDLCVMDLDGRGVRILVRDLFGPKWRNNDIGLVIRPQKMKIRNGEDVTITFRVKNLGDNVLSLGNRIEVKMFLANHATVDAKGHKGIYTLLPKKGSSFSLHVGKELQFSVTYAWQRIFPLVAKHKLSKGRVRLAAEISCFDRADHAFRLKLKWPRRQPSKPVSVKYVSSQPIIVQSRQ